MLLTTVGYGRNNFYNIDGWWQTLIPLEDFFSHFSSTSVFRFFQVVSETDMNQSVYVYRCEGSTIKVSFFVQAVPFVSLHRGSIKCLIYSSLAVA